MTSDKEVFSRTIDTVFIHSVIMSVISEGEPELCDAIKEYFVSHGLQVKPELIAKVSIMLSTILFFLHACFFLISIKPRGESRPCVVGRG